MIPLLHIKLSASKKSEEKNFRHDQGQFADIDQIKFLIIFEKTKKNFSVYIDFKFKPIKTFRKISYDFPVSSAIFTPEITIKNLIPWSNIVKKFAQVDLIQKVHQCLIFLKILLKRPGTTTTTPVCNKSVTALVKAISHEIFIKYDH